LAIRRVGGFSSDCCVVTFDSWTDIRSFDRPGFGEHFLASRGIDAIHVIARENDWYQYPEMLEAMAAVHEATRAYRRVVTYGSSMGAYAALRLAGVAGAHCALAMSPQFSINPAVAPFEYRWESAAKRFQGVWEESLAYPVLDEAYVVYDPYNLDMRHIDLLAARMAFTHVRLLNAGHPASGYLLDLDLIQNLVTAVCEGRFDPVGLVAKARRRRRESSHFYAVLADRTPPARSDRRIALFQEACRVAPQDAGRMCALAVELGHAGRFEDAFAMHDTALAAEPGHPNFLWHKSFTMEESGDLAGALAIVEEIDAATGGAPIYQPRLLDLRARVAAANRPAEPAPSPPPVRRLARLRTQAARLLRLGSVP
jgi:pimeloyl-ACP methyl ester carboxylesterase